MPSNYGLLIDAHQDPNYGFDFYTSLATGNTPDKIWVRSDINNVKSSWINLAKLVSNELGIRSGAASINESLTLQKGQYEQGVLFCSYSGGAPSIFSLNRASIAATIVEGSVNSSNISFVNSGEQVQIAADSSSYVYATLIVL